MVERYGAEEIQGTDGPPEFYFQTHGAEPGELKELLDRICGPGQYALKMVALDRWILRSARPLTLDEQDQVKRCGSTFAVDSTTPSPRPDQFQPVRTESNSFYFRPVARTGTSATQRSRRAIQDSAVAAAVANLWSRIRKGRRDQDPMVSSPTPPNIAPQPGTV